MSKNDEDCLNKITRRCEKKCIKDQIDNKTVFGYIFSDSNINSAQNIAIENSSINTDKKYRIESFQGEKPFSYISQKWLDFKKTSVKESSWIKYRNILNNYILPYIGSLSISSIDYAIVSDLCTMLLLSGGKNDKNLSHKTVSDILAIIRSIIIYASRMKYYTDKTALDVSIKTKSNTISVFSVSEEKLLLKYLTHNQSLINLGVIICLFTGIRIGELCALQWSDVSLENNIIHICKTMQRIQTPEGTSKTKIVITEPKSSSSIRDIPIAEYLKYYLNQHSSQHGFILTGDPMELIEPRTMQYKFKHILKECGIKETNFHVLRHTFATRCIEAGVDAKSLSEILGHSNVNITLGRYVHPSMETKKKNIDLLTNVFPLNNK